MMYTTLMKMEKSVGKNGIMPGKKPFYAWNPKRLPHSQIKQKKEQRLFWKILMLPAWRPLRLLQDMARYESSLSGVQSPCFVYASSTILFFSKVSFSFQGHPGPRKSCYTSGSGFCFSFP